jgi:hypothetical protein
MIHGLVVMTSLTNQISILQEKILNGTDEMSNAPLWKLQKEITEAIRKLIKNILSLSKETVGEIITTV